MINETFTSYYKTLYTSESPDNSENQKEENKLCIPSIADDFKAQMGRKLDASEIADAIIHLRGGKAAGPDGLPVDLHKILNSLNHSLLCTKLPFNGIVSLIPIGVLW